MNPRLPLLAACFTAGFLPASGQVTFRKVIDATTVPPGETAAFSGFHEPGLRGGTVAFTCQQSFQQRSVILAERDGSLHRVATHHETQFDGATLLLMSYDSDPLLRPDGSVVFEAFVGQDLAVLEWKNGTLQKLFDEHQAVAVAGPDIEYTSHVPVVTEDGRVLRQLSGPGAHNLIIQEQAGTLSVLQRSDVVLPPFNQTGGYFACWNAFRDGLVFFEYPSTARVYRKIGSRTDAIGEYNVSFGFAPIPGSISVTDLKASARLTVLVGRRKEKVTDDIHGLHGWAGGSWFTIAEQGMAAPDGGTYLSVPPRATEFSLENGSLVFPAQTTLGHGIFLYHAGTVTPLIRAGDPINGGTFQLGLTGAHALSGHQVALVALTTPSSCNGVHVADISTLLADDPAVLPATTIFGPGEQIRISVEGRVGHAYYLLRSTDLGAWDIIDQKAGNDSPLEFTRDERSAGTPRAYFRVEEVKL
jgi:hypothetical protein